LASKSVPRNFGPVTAVAGACVGGGHAGKGGFGTVRGRSMAASRRRQPVAGAPQMRQVNVRRLHLAYGLKWLWCVVAPFAVHPSFTRAAARRFDWESVNTWVRPSWVRQMGSVIVLRER
jgi:hypothetical protein